MDETVTRPTGSARLWLAAIATLAALCIAGAGNLLYETIRDCAVPDAGEAFRACVSAALPGTRMKYAVVAVLSAAFFVLSVLGIPVFRRAFPRSRANMRVSENAPRFKAVIFGLSRIPMTPGADGMPVLGDNPPPAARATQQAIEKVRAMRPGQLQQVLDELCSSDPTSPFGQWSWQQPLRMLRHNRGMLRIWCAVLTPESERQYKTFKLIVEPLLNEMGAALERVGGTVGPHDYNAITSSLEEAVRFCRDDWRCSQRSICIDMTSSTAVFSAAATVRTLNSEMKLGYVVTAGAPNAGEVVVYEPSLSV